MEKKYFLLFFILPMFITAQNFRADSLIHIFKQETDTSKKTELLNMISDAYKTSDPVIMQKYALEALVSARKNNDKEEEAKAFQNLGTSHIILGNYDKALGNFNLSENILLSLKQEDKAVKGILAKVLGSKGIVYSEQNNYAKALENDFRAMRLYESINNRVQLAKIYNNIGVIYNSIDDGEKALNYFLKAYNIQKVIKDPALAVSCSNIGLIYLNNKDLKKAKAFFDESIIEFQKNPNKRDMGELYNNISQYYITKKDLKTAEKYLFDAVKISKDVENQFALSNTYLFLAKIYFEEGELDRSLDFVTKSLEISKELDLPEANMNGEKLLSDIFDKKGNKEQAFIHLKSYNTAKEKLSKIENAKERLKTELNFEFEKKQIEQNEKADWEKVKLIFAVLISATVLAGLFFFYRNKEREKTNLLQKQLTEFQHKALHLQMNPHFVFNCLAAISSFIMQNDKEDAIKYLAKFSKLMRLTLDFSQESAVAIDKEIEALRNYLELEQLRFNQKFDFVIDKDPLIEDDTALPSLLLQPYVENSVIHGVVPQKEKGMIKINFTQNQEFLICEIEDNGVGIETSKKLKENSVSVHKSMALEISRKRLETLEELEKKKVSLEIFELKNEKGESEGTKVLLMLPLQYIKN
ncbi:hypothetical protein CEY12_16945 [Chryseobacterium sp. T16E-39]|uniref:tetratricopeptide repeat-containing sensor histidine kinase n=1 Tax=Chryseobacterium sp. T16E-39 TaxID=2015076 RepID=UPI000B5B1F67|nr:tetratricopeptide repeat protein [Chryseobacterium sp. T16E-39]ASK31696.1 hypothetical protein CEY12_16945 [Chryseobacterium sp. T16E-39]